MVTVVIVVSLVWYGLCGVVGPVWLALCGVAGVFVFCPAAFFLFGLIQGRRSSSCPLQ